MGFCIPGRKVNFIDSCPCIKSLIILVFILFLLWLRWLTLLILTYGSFTRKLSHFISLSSESLVNLPLKSSLLKQWWISQHFLLHKACIAILRYLILRLIRAFILKVSHNGWCPIRGSTILVTIHVDRLILFKIKLPFYSLCKRVLKSLVLNRGDVVILSFLVSGSLYISLKRQSVSMCWYLSSQVINFIILQSLLWSLICVILEAINALVIVYHPPLL